MQRSQERKGRIPRPGLLTSVAAMPTAVHNGKRLCAAEAKVMSCRSWWWLGLAGVVALLPAAGLADTGSSDKGSEERNQSHIPIPLHGMDLQQALADRLQV